MSPGTPRLSEIARHVVIPDGITATGWPGVKETCRRLGWEFDPWQDGAGRLFLGKRSDGLYAADTIVMSIPRQCGKTYLVGCIIFAVCLMQPGLTVIWTAHRKTTAAETFESFAGMAQRPKVAPHIAGVLRGRGDEKVLFTNGSRILFGARESGFGRGFSDVDIIVFDEAQIMTETTLEDMSAAQNVAVNPLTFMMGTPPRPKDPGEVFTLMRQEALDGESDSTAYIEFSADRGADPMARAQWRKANPSFPHRTTERAMLRLRKKLKSADSWAREALGIWDEVAVHQAITTPNHWRSLIDTGPAGNVAPTALGIDMSHGLAISIAGCWIEESGSAHIEEVWAGTDVAAAINWTAAVAGRRTEVMIDDLSPAAQMIPELKARGVKVHRGTARDMVKGCLLVDTRIKDEQLTHADQKPLTDALMGARKRPIHDAGGWGWDRRDSTVTIHPIVAATLALYCASTKRPAPATRTIRKAVIG
ncbi:hypothetical protein MINS_12360 [Mycolicibacterium insubricum]|uniref:Terminase n=1 Tax=Mycolicibacterium insubricum TaxID=444597 RepID=A0A1X0CSD7_9MYCO|nr:DEAD/DEAH box helicase family protein [Mycolicibacterium insubricum]MCV7083277.1 DEAD/DEAH box helicase family protein [Mycolicibacterium insubricum]ORA62822.1 terminase [Mycolicibacterium insubricum]BBZ65807.1 hypothetical protein MINS_12360 [Mycolicibacterium insubricum]